MRLTHPFFKFPFRFDVDRLREEVEALPETAWREHHEGFEGNSALTLITTNGTDNDNIEPPMRPTEHLLNSPYLLQVLARFRTLHGRARLMRLAPRAGVPPHVDIQYYWRSRARVHIPVVTHPDIKFRCGGESVHMAAGEAWTFDNWRTHQVVNNTEVSRVHLTFDTFGSNTFWSYARPSNEQLEAEFVPYKPGEQPALTCETHVGDAVMPPGEVDFELSKLATDVTARPDNDPGATSRFVQLLAAFRSEWRLLWHAKGASQASLPLFQMLLRQFEKEVVATVPDSVKLLSNGKSALEVLLADLAAMARVPGRVNNAALHAGAREQIVPVFDRPVFIIAAPRSGSTMLFEALAKHNELWTLGGEGHAQIEDIAALNPANRDFASNRLTAADVTPDVVAELRAAYAASLRSAGGIRFSGMGTARPRSIRFLEKTPKNALRIPFLRAAFPTAKFIFLYREAGPNISAIMEAWNSGRFVTYRELPGWDGPPWSMLLVPGWQNLKGATIAQIAMRQWRETNNIVLDDLAKLPRKDWCAVRYEDILADPAGALARLCAFAEVPFGEAVREVAAAPLRWSSHTLTPPDPEKWRKNEPAIVPFAADLDTTLARLRAL